MAGPVNDIAKLLDKIERRLGLTTLVPHLPKEFGIDAWASVIEEDTLVTFSRYFPQKIPFVINSETAYKKRDRDKKMYYYIKDEYLNGVKLLGVKDIDWQDTSSDNISIGQTAGYGYYTPNYGGMEDTINSFLEFQNAADTNSLYNNQIFLEFTYPNKLWIGRAGNVEVNLPSFVVELLVQHTNLQTISPTMMETFEALAQADIARFLYMNLRFYDQLETVYVSIDLKLSELQDEASKRDSIIDTLKESYVSASNDAIPYIITTSG
jgi:hypothetical protein